MLLSGILGTVTGILGNAVGGWFKYKEKKLQIESVRLQHEHDEKMIELETKSMILETKANIRKIQSEVEGEIEVKEIDAIIEAQKQEGQNIFSNKWIDNLMKIDGWWRIITLPIASLIAFLFGFVDFIRKLVRPALTIYLVATSTWITWMAWEIMKLNNITITATQATSIFLGTTEVMLYLCVSACTFWFGDRQMSKYIMGLKGADVNKMDDDINIK